MSKEEQIKDICKLICATCAQFDGCAINCKAHKNTAEALYNAGYRKVIGDRDSFSDLLNEEVKELSLIDKIRRETVKEFANQVKNAFYTEFDEVIPSIMASKIDAIAKEITGGA